MLLSPGDLLDRFTIVARIGAGGMGEVYRARDSHLDREVALKILRSASGSGLLREARAAAALEHPNVVAVYDVAEARSPESLAGTAYMTMELVDGKSLRDLALDRSIGLAVRIKWLADIARALAAAHRRGLVHRDVKPANVMIRSDGQVKVLDFGIAKLGPRVDASAETNTDTTVSTGAPSHAGTPPYMAPEQLLSEPIDGRADQFAWGVTAYELLCGARPWASEADAIHLAAEILSREPTAPAKRNAAISPEISQVVMRALEKSRERRFPTMDALLEALSPAARSATRRRWPLAVSLIGGVALLVGCALLWRANNRRVAVPPSVVTSSPSVVTSPPSVVTPAPAAAPIKPKAHAKHATNPSGPPLFFP